jgi:hypothetical protein
MKLRTLFSILLLFPVIPHELGHFICRRMYGVNTKAIAVGDVWKPPLYSVGWLQIHPLSFNTQGGVIPLHENRAFLPRYQQALTYVAGVWMDCICMFMVICLLPLLSIGGLAVAVYIISMTFAQALGNIIPSKTNDGMKIWEIGIVYWIIAFLSVIIMLLANLFILLNMIFIYV